MSDLEEDILMAYLAQNRQIEAMTTLLDGYREVHLYFDLWLRAMPVEVRDRVPARENALLVAAIAKVLELEHDVHTLSTTKEDNDGP